MARTHATWRKRVSRNNDEKEAMMTASPNRLLDDFARLVTDAAGAAQGVRREVETLAKSQIERLLRDMDLVTRDEFEAVRDMAILAREENERLALRLAALETEPAAATVKPATGNLDAGKPLINKPSINKPSPAKPATRKTS